MKLNVDVQVSCGKIEIGTKICQVAFIVVLTQALELHCEATA
jgi:hypothetical protein